MKRVLHIAFFTITILIFATGAVPASDKALLIIQSDTYEDLVRTADEIEAAGCKPRHIIPNKVIIADIPPEAEDTVRALPNLVAIYRTPVPEYAMTSDSDTAAGISLWNALLSPAPSAPANAQMPVDDAKHTPDSSGIMAAASSSRAPGYYDTSNFMLGRVAVGVVLPESTGNGENWTTSRQDTVFNQIVKGLDQWVSISGNAHLSFVYEKHFSVSTSYEPIQTSDDDLWINDVMAHLGYTSGSKIDRTRAFDNAIRSRLGSDWAYTIFVADSLNDSDGCFPGGGFAYSQLFGPYLVMTYDNTTWGISNMFRLAAHESGHIFCAGDEYDTSGCSTNWYFGYLWVPNSNCENNNPNTVPCIMQHNATNGSGVIVACQHTKYALGWRDSNSNNRYDPIDCTINSTLNPVSSPTNLINITFTGTTSITPCPCGHPHESWGGPNTCTINKIASVKYWMDSGSILNAAPVDGAFNSDSEDYTFTINNIPAGTHTIFCRAYDGFANTSALMSQTIIVGNPDPTPPIMGTVIDSGDVTYQDIALSASWSATEPDSSIREYQCAIGVSPADPGSGYVKDWASTGTNTSITVSGLDLVDGQSYYFYVKAKNSSDIWSTPASSDGIRVTLPSIATAKSLAPDTTITLKDRIVTAAYTGRFYIQDSNDFSGIAVSYNGGVLVGDKVTVRGKMGRGDSSTVYERSVGTTSTGDVSVSSSNNTLPRAVCMLTKMVGGAPLNVNTPGVVNGTGLNNIGLLVRICGRVYKKYSGKFYVDDGCVIPADNTNKGVRVESAKAVNVGDVVVCTGVVSTYDPGTLGGALAVIKTRGLSDVAIVAQ